MADKIQLTPTELQAQATEMRALQEEYSAFFSNVSSELKSVNGNWSANLSHGFEGKINTAQKSFTMITQELMNGAKVADACAVSFATIDSELAKLYCEGDQSASENGGFLDAIKKEIGDIPSDIGSVGEALQWVEEHYGDLPIPESFRTIALSAANTFLPSSLKTAYEVTSDLTQGDFWAAGDGVLNFFATCFAKKNAYVSGVISTITYTFGDRREALQEKIDAEMMEQLEEGDYLGMLIDGLEGSVDTIIGGSIECLAYMAGGKVDGYLDGNVFTKAFNKGVEFLSGCCNGGDSKSVGDLIGIGGEFLSDSLDKATDILTEATDYVTDGLTNIGSWIKGWF